MNLGCARVPMPKGGEILYDGETATFIPPAPATWWAVVTHGLVDGRQDVTGVRIVGPEGLNTEVIRSVSVADLRHQAALQLHSMARAREALEDFWRGIAV